MITPQEYLGSKFHNSKLNITYKIEVVVQWGEVGENAPKKVKTIPSTGKVMTPVSWASRGVVLIDYLEKGRTIVEAYYSSLIDKL